MKFTGKIHRHNNYYCCECKKVTTHAGNIYEISGQDIEKGRGSEIEEKVIYECLDCSAHKVSKACEREQNCSVMRPKDLNDCPGYISV